MTPRLLLQLLGTDCGRHILHPHIWANAMFADYNDRYHGLIIADLQEGTEEKTECPESKWIITDVRFPNEVKAIEDRGGIVIRVNRPYNMSPYSWDKSCPCCRGTKTERFWSHESGWVHRHRCNSCDSTFTINYGDKMGGGFDSLDIITNKYKPHASEIGLDDYEFDNVIENKGTLEDLIKAVRAILIANEILEI